MYGNSFHVYPDHRLCHTWNNIRSLRILPHDIAQNRAQKTGFDLLSTETEDSTADAGRRSKALGVLCAEICASVRQHISPRHHIEVDTTFISNERLPARRKATDILTLRHWYSPRRRALVH